MRGELGLEITVLTVATLATLVIFFMHQVHFALAVCLIALYAAYLWLSSTSEVEEPELMGAAALIGSLPEWRRRATVVFLFAFAAAVILIAAEPFVDGLVETGQSSGSTSSSSSSGLPRWPRSRPRSSWRSSSVSGVIRRPG